MKKLIANLATVALLLSCAGSAWAGNEKNLGDHGIALEGYDPVSYFKSPKPLKGKDTFQAKDDGATYLFSSEENKQAFLKEPKKYEPEFGGWCAYAVADSKAKVSVDPLNFLIQDGKLLVFYDGPWSKNTRTKWQDPKGKGSKEFLTEAEKNWPQVKGTEP
jgi:YHS domain-containing protein